MAAAKRCETQTLQESSGVSADLIMFARFHNPQTGSTLTLHHGEDLKSCGILGTPDQDTRAGRRRPQLAAANKPSVFMRLVATVPRSVHKQTVFFTAFFSRHCPAACCFYKLAKWV